MPSREPTNQPRVLWETVPADGAATRRLLYRGPLRGSHLRLHYAFDGWQGPPREVPLEPVAQGDYLAEIPDSEGHLALDCVVTDGEQWDNNGEADYRLWLTVDPFDAHLHVSGAGDRAPERPTMRVAPDLQVSFDEAMRNLEWPRLAVALQSAGIAGGLASWLGNPDVARALEVAPGLQGLVWVQPGTTPLDDVERYLASGFVGLKFHPTIDDYRADDATLDPYLDLATRLAVPACIHSAPGDADPDFIRRLAERFPRVPILLYHTYLGPVEGRWRAAQHAREQPNLYLETSWCRAGDILRLTEDAGVEKVIFGSDASIDGVTHFCRQPPNVDGEETYNDGLLRLVRALDPAAAKRVMGDTARHLFGLDREGRS